MGRKLYVGNLSYQTTSDDLKQLFAPHGTPFAPLSLCVASGHSTGAPSIGCVRHQPTM